MAKFNVPKKHRYVPEVYPVSWSILDYWDGMRYDNRVFVSYTMVGAIELISTPEQDGWKILCF